VDTTFYKLIVCKQFGLRFLAKLFDIGHPPYTLHDWLPINYSVCLQW
jgi:hypothetical protein